jgi:tripartite-type tricarboxylate transporter receptor subunit TctC
MKPSRRRFLRLAASVAALSRGTQSEIIDRLHREIEAGLADPAVKAQLEETGSVPMPLSPGEFGALLSAETEKWEKVEKSSGAKSQ